ncbi:MAG: hypothetical protein IKL59_02745 [Clostridia bacterium]|nr:hypothetical protein [Clostridia bacterium]
MKIKTAKKALSLVLVVMMLMSTFAMMFAYADEAAPVTTPKDYATAEDGEKLWDADFSSEYFTPIDDTTEVFQNNGITYSANGTPGGNSAFKSAWRKNLTAEAVVIENNGTTLKIDGAKTASGADVPSEATKADQRFIGQINVYDLENKTYTYEFDYFRNGIVRSKFYFANGSFMNFGGCDTNMPNLGLEVNKGGYRLMRQSSAVTTGVVGKPSYVTDETTGELSTRMKVVLEGGAKIDNVTLYEGKWLNAAANVKKWVGSVIPVTFSIYNSVVKEDGTVQDIRVATNLIYQPSDIKLIFGIGEYNNPAENQYYGIRNLAIYKGNTSIPFNFNFNKVYSETEWGAELTIFDAKGITNAANNFTNGYAWSTLSGGDGVTVDMEGIITINHTEDKSQGAYTPHPFGNEWNTGYYEMEMTVNNAHRLKVDIIKSGDQDRVGFNLLPNGSVESLAASMGDETAYLAAGNAASIYVSAGNQFGTGVINAGGLKTIVYDTFDATDADGDGQPDDPRNVRDYGGNRANVKITYDCENYIITLYEKVDSEWVATAAIDYSESVEQNLDSELRIGFMAYDKNTCATIKNIRAIKGYSAAHLHTYAIGDVETDVYAYYDETVPAALAAEFAAKYGLTNANFGWTVDGETLCEDMKTAYDDLSSTNYGPQTIKLAPIVVYETLATDPVIRGIQIKYNADKTAYDVRFVSAVGSLDSFAKIGYDVTKTVKAGGETTTTTHTLETTEVSVYINANGMRYYASALGGKYAAALGFKGEAVIENSEVTYEVTAYYIARNGEKVVCGDVVSFVLTDGQY